MPNGMIVCIFRLIPLLYLHLRFAALGSHRFTSSQPLHWKCSQHVHVLTSRFFVTFFSVNSFTLSVYRINSSFCCTCTYASLLWEYTFDVVWCYDVDETRFSMLTQNQPKPKTTCARSHLHRRCNTSNLGCYKEAYKVQRRCKLPVFISLKSI